jgi:hypothetical protein
MTCAFGFICKPRPVQHLFSGWIRGFPKKGRPAIYVGDAAILWSIWKTRNNACIRSKPDDPLAALALTNMIGQLASSWDILQVKETNRNALIFFDQGNILISKYTNYTQLLQQRNTLITVRIHTAKKDKIKLRKKSPAIVSQA